MNRKFAFLATGKLYIADPDRKSEVVESRFAQKAIETAQEIHQKKEWRMNSMFGGQMPMGNSHEFDPLRYHVLQKGVCAGERENLLLYLLETEASGGLFSYDLESQEEQRVFHFQDFRASDLSRHDSLGWLTCSLTMKDQTANIIVMNEDGSDQRELTSGDSIDSSPSWVPGEDLEIIYQSSGIGRDQDGFMVGLGPASIQKLDLKSQKIETVLEAEDRDYILPRIDDSGNLYYIERPYEAAPTPEVTTLLADVLLFPFRLVRAFIMFLNAFSMMFTQKPLITSTGQQMRKEDQMSVQIRGRWVETQKAMRKWQKDDTASLVPDTWVLMKRDQSGNSSIVAKEVVSYDIDSDGTLIYTNGAAIFQIDQQGKKKTLLKHRLINDVTLL